MRLIQQTLDKPGEIVSGDWLHRVLFPSEYDSIYFPAGYGLISDREIRLAFSYSQNASDNPCTLYTYRFDEEGNLIEIEQESMDRMWYGYM